MTQQLPKRPRAHILEDLSLQYLHAVFPSEWICRRVEDDYGLDMRVEIVAGGLVTAEEFSIQLKATDHLKISGGDVVHRCKVSTANYFLRRPEPVMYVVYDVQESTAYWLWVQPYLGQLDETTPSWRERKTVQIRIPQSNRLTSQSLPTIASHVHAWWARTVRSVGWEYTPGLEETHPPPPPSPETPVELTQQVSPRALRVFLCHSSDDKSIVRSLYKQLVADGVDPWLDEEKLLPGQDWRLEIAKAVRTSDIVLVCLSRSSITRAGYVQKEIRLALDVADEQPEGAIFVIPVKLEECDVPERLSRWQWVDLFSESGYERLMLALKARADELTDRAQRKTESIEGTLPSPSYPDAVLDLRSSLGPISAKLLDFELGDITSEQKAIMLRELDRLRKDAIGKRDTSVVRKIQEMQKRLNALIPKGLFEYDFSNFDEWKLRSGRSLEFRGRSLKLVDHDHLRNVLLNDRLPEFMNGEIECEVYLEEGALFNVMLRGDISNDFYMARLDTRPTNWDCFLIRPVGQGWRECNARSTLKYHSPHKQWLKMRVVADGKKLSLYRDNELVDGINNAKVTSGTIGLFAEVSNVYVRKVRVLPETT
jgi:hypothetical protein